MLTDNGVNIVKNLIEKLFNQELLSNDRKKFYILDLIHRLESINKEHSNDELSM